MIRWLLGAIITAALWVPAIESASAGCVRFEEARSGEAALINACGVPVNVGYSVSRQSSGTDSADMVHLPMAAGSRMEIWAAGHAPVTGEYRIKIYSCSAPTILVYPRGGRPTCQLNSADAG